MDLPHRRLHKLDTAGRAFKPSSDKPEKEAAIEGQSETETKRRGDKLFFNFWLLLTSVPFLYSQGNIKSHVLPTFIIHYFRIHLCIRGRDVCRSGAEPGRPGGAAGTAGPADGGVPLIELSRAVCC